jgi:NitT/TauT family transport system substrate-binding protein
MKRQSGSILGLLLLLAFILSACAPVSPQQTTRLPLRVEWTLYEADYTVIIAQEKGFFEQHGVNVEPIYYENYSQLFPDIAEEKVDGGLFTIGDMLRTSILTPLKGVIAYDSGGTVQIVSTTEITNVADLKGKKIGLPIGATEEKYVREMLSREGLTIKDVQLVDTQVEEVPNRLGIDIDAGYVYPPFDQMAVDLGYKILYVPTESLNPDVIAFRADVIEERPEDIQAFVDAWFDALQYRMDNMDECNQIIAQKTGLTVDDVATVSAILYNRQNNLSLFSENAAGWTIYEITQKEIAFLNLKGQLTFPIDEKQMYDPSFVQ